MDKNSLLASLTGDQLGVVDNASNNENNAEQDLFGDIAIHEPPSVGVPTSSGIPLGAPLPPATYPIQEHSELPIQNEPTVGGGQAAAANTYAPMPAPSVPPIQNVPPVNSLLSKSGLLGAVGTTDDSGGLFDEVDRDEQKEPAPKDVNQNIGSIGPQSHQQQFQAHNSLQNGQNPNPVSHGNFAAKEQSAMIPQPHLTNQMSAMTLNNPESSGFYRDHNTPSSQNNQIAGTMSPNGNGGAPPNGGGYFYGTREQQIQQPPQQYQQPNGFAQPTTTAGMHNASQTMNLGKIRKVPLVKPQDVSPLYVDIRVTEPMLIQTQSFLISSPPYWSYQITSQLAGNQGTWLVRRRFRHVVALEDRLRQACPGSIIPPRPEKHATRALEEASTQQSAEFAVQRSKELAMYLNQVARHPVAGQSQVLRLFLGLQDDIGTAWPEVSSNALTRLQAVGAGVTMKVAESTAASSPAHEWEEDAELLSLCSSENLRLGAVSQSVPKLEGTVIVLREKGDAAGILGMELSKASKSLDVDYKFFDVLSSGLLRHGRRTKRLALEMSGAMDSFLQQYKLVRYEKMAMQDRRNAIQRKAKERGRADARAVHLSQQQRHLQMNGQIHHLNHLEQSAITMDTKALDAVSEADEIGTRLKLEINRVAIDRRTAWNTSIKTIARSMKEACSERREIWETTLEAFEKLTKNDGFQ